MSNERNPRIPYRQFVIRFIEKHGKYFKDINKQMSPNYQTN